MIACDNSRLLKETNTKGIHEGYIVLNEDGSALVSSGSDSPRDEAYIVYANRLAAENELFERERNAMPGESYKIVRVTIDPANTVG